MGSFSPEAIVTNDHGLVSREKVLSLYTFCLLILAFGPVELNVPCCFLPLYVSITFPNTWCYSDCADYSQSESVPVNVHISELFFAMGADSDIFLNMSEKQECHTLYFV